MTAPNVLLIVDDSDDHRFITVTELRRLASQRAFVIEEASSGADALILIDQHVRQRRNLLVLADYRMPRMSGIELAKAVRARFPGKPIRFVVYSSTDQGVAEESVRAGANEFMVKPMELQEFRSALKRLVEDWQQGKDGSAKAARRSI